MGERTNERSVGCSVVRSAGRLRQRATGNSNGSSSNSSRLGLASQPTFLDIGLASNQLQTRMKLCYRAG
ncbi:hypothetical protein M0802_006599 [Mischocyttarus mexicanus]|nr:hypothetical protein M0802_006599 [Mischocyttarus mexicanus]